MSRSINLSALVLMHLLTLRAFADAPPRLEVAVADPNAPLTFVAYGDTRFTRRDGVANVIARRALIGRVANEHPAAIFIGGDLVYNGSDPQDFETYGTETGVWSEAKIPIFPALGNHEFRGCDADAGPCLANWWRAAAPSAVRPFRWYSVALGPKILVLLLVLVVLHYPPVRDPVFPRAKDEQEVERFLSKQTHSLQTSVVVVSSHVHNYERFVRNDVIYLVSGGGGAKPVPVLRMSGELSKLHTAENFHYIRFRLVGGELQGFMVRFEPQRTGEAAWTEPDHFEIEAPDHHPDH